MINLTDEDRRKMVQWALRHRDFRKVYLYGSRARGDNRPDSDIDLAIEMTFTNESDAFGAWILWHEAYKKKPDLHLSHEVDLNWYMKGAGLEKVGPGVERDGIVLYRKA